MRFSLVLCDVDNTLMDFHSAERAAYAAVAARFSLPDDDVTFAVYKAINTRQWKRFARGETSQAQLRIDRFRDFATALGLPDEDILPMSAYFVQALGEQALPVPGAEDFLLRISALAPVILVTNGFAAVQTARFARSPLRRYISGLLISENFQNPKPHPEMLLAAMAQAGVTDPAQVVMIGDSEESDIMAAQNAGVQSILFTFGAPPPAATRATCTVQTLRQAGDWITGA